MVKDCRHIAVPVMFNMTPYAVQTENRYPYQLGAVISHLGNPENDQGHYMRFLRIFSQWIRFNDTEVEPVEESAALHENFPETEGFHQTATILLYVADNWINNSVNSLWIKYSLIMSILISQLTNRSHRWS
jgi:ubiquitin C-terminal hydrolase